MSGTCDQLQACLDMSAFGRDLLDTLYYGDNLEILSRFISDESVDLVYLDPPFNKNAAYSVIFRDESGRTSDAQMATLEDYWHWGPTPARHYEYLTNSTEHRGAVPHAVSALMGALHTAIRPSPLLAYLVEMTVRLVELHRVLRATGSLWLHCDPTASHYLKIVLDALFGPEQFLAEVTWKRWSAHGDAKRFGSVHDVLLYYGKTRRATFNKQFARYDPAYVRDRFKFQDSDGRRWAEQNLVSPNPRPNLTYPYTATNGVTYQPHRNGWKVTPERMRTLDQEGRLHFPKRGDRLRLKVYLDEQPGAALQDVWTDIYGVGGTASERLGYPTQKPVALLERIVRASSNPGEVVLDPFCGCGTALEAAADLDRRWIGIDISNLAVKVISDRMAKLGIEVPVFDWPTEMDGVRQMVDGPDGKHRFETWALARLGLPENKRGSDAGMDGRIGFTLPSGKVETIIVSVKGGRHVGSPEVRDLKGAMARERAATGLLFTLDNPSSKARKEAMEAGFYRSPVDGRQYRKLLTFSARELLEEGRLPDLPTRHGVLEPFWPLPAATRSVRLRAMKGTAPIPLPLPLESVDRAAEIREAYIADETAHPEPSEAVNPADPLSPRPSRRNR